jgi:hypothetical protein
MKNNNLTHQQAAQTTGLKMASGWFASLLLVGFLFVTVVSPAQAAKPVSGSQPQANTETVSPSPIPSMAYYYIWFDSNSWNRAKTDFPMLGRYTSDDRAVMRQQIQWAKAAGIKGFIVSWKSTDVLNRRLEQLVSLAEEEDFKLAVIYQGLDFDRNPQPVDRINSDLDVFTQRFASRKPFDLFAKPLVIWSGTWKFSPEQIAQVSTSHRKDLLLLASERNLAGYKRLANLVDGNAYYWSSVNPETFPDYPGKLVAMADAVHKNGGLWIPPAAPGFDARLIGGTTVVDRKNGDTFRAQIGTALASSPDVLGIISWNEFSENSHIEPSKAFGAKYLDILSEINHLPAPKIGEFDSSEAAGVFPDGISNSRKIAFGVMATLAISALVVIARRRK